MKQLMTFILLLSSALILSNCATERNYVPLYDAGYFDPQEDRLAQEQGMPLPPEDIIDRAANDHIENDETLDPLDQAAVAQIDAPTQVQSSTSTVEYHYHTHNHYYRSRPYRPYDDFNPWGYPYYVTDYRAVYQPYSPIVYYNYYYYDYPYTTAGIHYNPFWGAPVHGYYYGGYYSYPYGITIAYSSFPYYSPYYHHFYGYYGWHSDFYWRHYWRDYYHDRFEDRERERLPRRYARPQNRLRQRDIRIPQQRSIQEPRRRNYVEPSRRAADHSQPRRMSNNLSERREAAPVQDFQESVISSFFEGKEGPRQVEERRQANQQTKQAQPRSSNQTMSEKRETRQTESRRNVNQAKKMDSNTFPERNQNYSRPRYYQSLLDERSTFSQRQRSSEIELFRRPNNSFWSLRTQPRTQNFLPMRENSSTRSFSPPTRSFSVPRNFSPSNRFRSSPSNSPSRSPGTSSFRSSPRTSAPRSFSSPRIRSAPRLSSPPRGR